MNKTGSYRLTIIVPVYNEEANIDRLEEAFRNYLPKASCPACVLFVNDGSTDGSLPRLIEICSRNQHFYYISFERNAGLSAAIKAGIDNSFSELTGYIDADLQTTPEDFERLLPFTDRYALVTGIRTDRKDSRFKRFQSRLANGFRRMMTHDDASDTGCPLKILHTDAAKRIPFFKGMHRFLPALIRLQRGGEFAYMEIAVRHFPRTAGTSKFGMSNRLLGPLADCFAYRWMKKRYINYRIEDGNL